MSNQYARRTSLLLASRATKVGLIEAGHVSASRARFARLTRHRFHISLAETIGLLSKRFQLSPHEFHLNSKHILDILGVAQVPNKLLGGGNVFHRIDFHPLAEFCPSRRC